MQLGLSFACNGWSFIPLRKLVFCLYIVLVLFWCCYDAGLLLVWYSSHNIYFWLTIDFWWSDIVFDGFIAHRCWSDVGLMQNRKYWVVLYTLQNSFISFYSNILYARRLLIIYLTLSYHTVVIEIILCYILVLHLYLYIETRCGVDGLMLLRMYLSSFYQGREPNALSINCIWP